MSRLQSAEEAIIAAEEVISHERANRKKLFQEIKKANQDLRVLVEQEKKTISDKVHNELDKHLQ
jgi:chromosome segregation ATPase